MSRRDPKAAKPLGPIPQGFVAIDGELAIGGRKVSDLVEEAGDTPLFVYSRDMLDARIDSAVRNLCRSGQRGVAARLEMQTCAADIRSAVQSQVELAMADARGAHLAGLTTDPEA